MNETHTYTDEELKGMQKKALEMADVFWQFCKKNDLLAYMCGGGCIGALRTGGFIPWDDDLDFFMPRDDYEKFIELWPEYREGSDYVLSVQSKEYNDRNIFATLRDKNTTYIKPYQADLDMVHGVQLDILPLDGYPKEKKDRQNQVLWALIYSLFCAGTVPEKHGKLMSVGCDIILKLIKNEKLRYLIWSTAKKHMTKFSISECDSITELCAGPGYMKNRYNKKWFTDYREVPFEDKMLPIPVGAENYLKKAFGDYMSLPPVEKRVAHHDCVYLDLDRPYTEYKGKYYCR